MKNCWQVLFETYGIKYDINDEWLKDGIPLLILVKILRDNHCSFFFGPISKQAILCLKNNLIGIGSVDSTGQYISHIITKVKGDDLVFKDQNGLIRSIGDIGVFFFIFT